VVTLAKSLTNLLKNNAPFNWTPAYKKAPNMLIDIITISSILCALDPNQQFELEVNASQYALGAILWQQDPAMLKTLQAVGFYSKVLTLAEMNYSIHNYKLLAIICAL
jgi:RNase H-like domain found in reverse transcriptase